MPLLLVREYGINRWLDLTIKSFVNIKIWYLPTLATIYLKKMLSGYKFYFIKKFPKKVKVLVIECEMIFLVKCYMFNNI
jgi:hypothetical protein